MTWAVCRRRRASARVINASNRARLPSDALRYTPERSRVEMRLRIAGNGAELTISDRGPGGRSVGAGGRGKDVCRAVSVIFRGVPAG